MNCLNIYIFPVGFLASCGEATTKRYQLTVATLGVLYSASSTTGD
ncbi:hypothetical protein ACOWPH_12080 [Anabaena sp. PCC 7938]|uniref:Uncharacterized protein n=1 Tax=Anabaena cylindrica (strain ATCC 27899 / PCC 7122) TaxID=272123 RepID=K9ZKZ2_ANACC|nr:MULTISPECIES: hypothetical protein [Anabaena]AFZ59005.1 hypothetical protein Anacy_3612 [Anabaena cylindrica PCC 7122]BAY03974.1 hypothetical protein NIES19_32300 [Anabaena cylindrica PCC 7122]